MEETAEMFQRARVHLDEVLNKTPNGDAYREAVERAPHLIALESDPDRYLRCEDNDPIAAAQRLGTYWNKRKEIFGQDAFRPMVQKQDGALRLDDVDILKTGFLTQLPNDGANRSVLFHDRSRLEASDVYPFEKRIRAAFYFLNVVSENESTQREGVVMIFFFGDNGPPIPKINYTSEQSDPFLSALQSMMASGAFPIRFKAAHVVQISKKQSVRQLARRYNNAILNTPPTSIPGTFYSYDAPDQVAPKLNRFGLTKQGLPIVLGGSIDTKESLRQWMITRTGLEAKQEHSRLLAETMVLRAAARGEGDLKEEEDRRKREKDKVYAQRKRARRKIEMDVMQEQLDWFTDQNRRLKATNTRLQDLLRQATIAVETYLSSKPTPREKRALEEKYRYSDDE